MHAGFKGLRFFFSCIKAECVHASGRRACRCVLHARLGQNMPAGRLGKRWCRHCYSSSSCCERRRWIPDDLGVPSFARLGELRKLPVSEYDGRYDLWTITAPLTEGCGGPELPEEVML